MKGIAKDGVSIIICCYNSAKLLPITLQHIAEQKINQGLSCELIIVNNNSSDDTPIVAENEWGKYTFSPINIKIINEENAGLSNARKKGVAEANFEYIIFCDDDNRLRNDYVQTAYNLLSKNVKIGAAGGYSEGIADNSFPDWWNEYKYGYAVGKNAEETGYIGTRNYVWGAGMVSRNSLLKKVFNEDFPSSLSDRKGEELNSGGDVEICARILLAGYLLYYDDALFLEHYITPNRLTEPYRDRMFEGHAKGVELLRPYHQVIKLSQLSVFQKIKGTVKEIVKITLTAFLRSKNKHSFAALASMWTVPSFTSDPMYKKILQFKKRWASLK